MVEKVKSRSVAASTYLFIIWMTGSIAAGPSPEHFSFKRWMQAAFWPVYVTWIEVGSYFDRLDKRRTEITGGSDAIV